MVKRARRLTAMRFPEEVLDAVRELGRRRGLNPKRTLTPLVEEAIRDLLKKDGVGLDSERKTPIRPRTRRTGPIRKQG